MIPALGGPFARPAGAHGVRPPDEGASSGGAGAIEEPRSRRLKGPDPGHPPPQPLPRQAPPRLGYPDPAHDLAKPSLPHRLEARQDLGIQPLPDEPVIRRTTPEEGLGLEAVPVVQGLSMDTYRRSRWFR